MQLTVAERADFIQIAKHVYDLWSAGLAKDVYRQFLCNTYYQSWSRRHNYRLVCKDQEEVVVSCKVVHLSLLIRGKRYAILGLGAIYAPAARRGQGLATDLVKSVINRADEEGFDGLLLFSDIDRQFYASCGFTNLGNLDFHIDPRIYSIEEEANWPENFQIEHRQAEIFQQKDILFCFSSFSPWIENDQLANLLSCHSRWLARQPYGIVRSQSYFAFQLARYLFISNYSQNKMPQLCLTTVKNGRQLEGYAFSEYIGQSMRILEIIGSQSARACLWQALIKLAQTMNLQRITGFESLVCDFIPHIRLDTDLLNMRPEIKPGQIGFSRRSWGSRCFSV